MHTLIRSHMHGKQIQPGAFHGMLGGLSREEKDLVVKAYTARHHKDVFDDLYGVLHTFGDKLLSDRLLAEATGQLLGGTASSAGPLQYMATRAGGDHTMFPGWDPQFPGNSIAVQGAAGEYALADAPLRIRYASHETVFSETGSGYRSPHLEKVLVETAAQGLTHLPIEADEEGQFVAFTPRHPGAYRLQYYVRHGGTAPGNHVQVIQQTLVAKDLGDLGDLGLRKLRETVQPGQGIELYRAQVALQQLQADAERSPALAGLNKYAGQIDMELELMAEGSEVPVHAVHVSGLDGAVMPMTLFIGKSKADPTRYHLADLSVFATRRHYEGDSVQAVIEAFDSDNVYPEGMVALEIPQNKRGIPTLQRRFTTDGESFLQSLSSGTAWASLGLTVLGFLAAIGPGTQVAVPYLFLAAAATGAASGTMSLVDRFEEAEVSKTGVVLDILGIASSIIAGAGAFKAASKGTHVLQLTRGGRFLLYSDFAVNGASTLLMGWEHVDQILAILDRTDLPRGHKIAAITRLLASMAINGGLYALSIRGETNVRSKLGGYFGASVVAQLDAGTVYLLSQLKDGQLRRLMGLTAADLPFYARAFHHDPAKALSLMDFGGFQSGEAFQKAFEALDEVGVDRMKEVLVFVDDVEIKDGRSFPMMEDNMQTRYKKMYGEISDGSLPAPPLGKRLEVLSNVGNFRSRVAKAALAISRNMFKNIDVGGRNIAYCYFDLVDKHGVRYRGWILGVSGAKEDSDLLTQLVKNDDVKLKLELEEQFQNMFGKEAKDFQLAEGLSENLTDGSRDYIPESHKRRHDAELKIMEQINRYIKAMSGVRSKEGLKDLGLSGMIYMHSEMSPCVSCSGVINDQVPGIFGQQVKVKVDYGIFYEEREKVETE